MAQEIKQSLFNFSLAPTGTGKKDVKHEFSVRGYKRVLLAFSTNSTW